MYFKMNEKSKQEEDVSHLKEFINKQTDEEILDILKKRKHYQPEAVEIAVEEAIERKLINSGQDLVKPEFQAEPLKRSLFPTIEHEKTRKKVRKSLGRSLLIVSLLPLIFGFTRFNAGNIAEGIGLFVFALIWGGFSTQIMLKGGRRNVNILLALSVLSVAYVGIYLQSMIQFSYFDHFVVVAFFLLIFYGLFFVRRLV
jgi:uncharacterized membrane-anchored protein